MNVRVDEPWSDEPSGDVDRLPRGFVRRSVGDDAPAGDRHVHWLSARGQATIAEDEIEHPGDSTLISRPTKVPRG